MATVTTSYVTGALGAPAAHILQFDDEPQDLAHERRHMSEFVRAQLPGDETVYLVRSWRPAHLMFVKARGWAP